MKKRRGLVLSGGAALGAFQAGALKALHEKGLEFEVISATSIGTLHAFAWNIQTIVPELNQHWLDNVAGFKPFSLERLFAGQNPFQFQAALDNLADKYRANYPFSDERSEVIITLTDYHSGQATTFSTFDPTLTDFEKELALKASTAIIHVGSKPVMIKGRKYYDGGYNNNVPIEPLLERDLDEIWVLKLRSPRPGPAQPWQVEAVSWLKDRFKAPLLNSTLGLARQALAETGAFDHNKVIEVAPGNETDTSFRVALLFSIENIQNLFDFGYQRALQVLQEYD